MPMTRQQAEFAFDNNPKLRHRFAGNREAGVRTLMEYSPEEIVTDIPAGSPLAPPEKPKVVTPASPAPMRPVASVVPPRAEVRKLLPDSVRQMAAQEEAGVPEQQAAPARALELPRAAPPASAGSGYVSPMRLAMKETERELGLLNYNKKKIADEGKPENPELDLAINLAERRLDQQRSIANAEEGATVNPERAAILARQAGRVKGEEERLASDVKRSPWEALTQGGLSMMNPQRGASFISALSSGLGTGLNSYTAARADAAERRARLGADTDALALRNLEALDGARDAARRSILEGKQLDERELRMAGMSDEQMERAATLPYRIETGRLAPKVAQANINQSEASADRDRASGRLADRTDPNARGTSGGEPTLGGKGAPSVLSSLAAREKALLAIIGTIGVPDADKADARAQLKEVRAERGRLSGRMGLTGGQPAAPAGGGALRPNAVYVPGKGLQPPR